MAAVTKIAEVQHGKVTLAVHELRGGGGAALLLLHGLGQQAPERVPDDVAAWAGPVHALDFTGHGASTIPVGGGYTVEILMADVDAVLNALGPCTVLGRGLGAYVALLVAGARAADVCGAILCDGPGITGGGPVPGSASILHVDAGQHGPPDPYALAELSTDVRPADYATSFVRLATQGSSLDEPIAVCARVRPPWLQAVAAEPGVRDTTLAAALSMFGR